MRRLRRQADACERLGSPLYGELLARCADEVIGGDVLYGCSAATRKTPAFPPSRCG